MSLGDVAQLWKSTEADCLQASFGVTGSNPVVSARPSGYIDSLQIRLQESLRVV